MKCSKAKQLSPEEQYKYRIQKERDMLAFYGMGQFSIDQTTNQNTYTIEEVEIVYQEQTHMIHTFKFGDAQKTPIVLLHGYGGTHAHYCKMYKKMVEQFYILAIDLPGMGYSSKDNIKITNFEDSLEYFLLTIDAWRQKLGLTNFILVGHSFGGYIAAQYAVRFPHLIHHLFLLSPAGTDKYTQEDLDNINNTDNLNFWKRKAYKFFREKWESQITVKDLNEKWYGKYFIKKYLNKRMNLQGEEFRVWKNYVDEIIKLPEGSEKSLYLIFQFPKVIAKKSIEELLTEKASQVKQMPINFQYGEQDWMDKKGALRLAQNFGNIKCAIIDKAGHQLNFENPDGVLRTLYQSYLEIVLKEQKVRKQEQSEESKQEIQQEIQQQIQLQ